MAEVKRVVVGRHSVLEALKVRADKVSKVYVDQNISTKKWWKELEGICKKKKVQIVNQKESFFSKLTQNSQGVACDVHESPEWPDEDNEKVCILALDSIEDPHNLGAIIRTAWLMGVDGILLPKKESAPLNATVSKIASGGMEHVPIKKVVNLKNEIADLKKDGFWSYGLYLGDESQDISKVVKSDKSVVIAGSEEKGIRPGVLKEADFKVIIPQKDPTASLNVSVSVGIALYTLTSNR